VLRCVHGLRAGHRRVSEGATGEDRFASAKLGDLGRLIGAGLAVGRLRNYHLAQRRLRFHYDAAIGRVLTVITRLPRIGSEVEKLRRHADVVHVLEGPEADHEGR